MSNRTVWVTGSSRGIGKAIAARFARCGDRVVLHCKDNRDALRAFEKELKQSGCSVMAVQGDIASEEDVSRMFGEICSRFGPVEILVNNAGIALPEQLLTDCTADQLESVLKTNVLGLLTCSRMVIPSMVGRKKGVIINVSSYLGVKGCSCETPYAASKAAVIGATKSLAQELAPSGIRVNSVAPGYVQTDMNAEYNPEEREQIRQNIPLERFGTPEDMANAVYFLSSDEAGFITGQTLCVDGGASL